MTCTALHWLTPFWLGNQYADPSEDFGQEEPQDATFRLLVAVPDLPIAIQTPLCYHIYVAMATIQPFSIFFQFFSFVSETFSPLRSILLEVFLCLRDQYTPKSQFKTLFGILPWKLSRQLHCPNMGIVTTLIDYYPLEQLFHEVKSVYLRWQLSEWLDQSLHAYILLKLFLTVLALLLFQCWLC